MFKIKRGIAFRNELGHTKVAYRDVSCYCDKYHQRFVSRLDKTVFKEKILLDWVKKVATAARHPPPIMFALIAHTSGGTEIVPSAVRATMSQLFMKMSGM